MNDISPKDVSAIAALVDYAIECNSVGSTFRCPCGVVTDHKTLGRDYSIYRAFHNEGCWLIESYRSFVKIRDNFAPSVQIEGGFVPSEPLQKGKP